MRRPKPKLVCCDTIKYIIPVQVRAKLNGCQAKKKTELDSDRSSNSISQWLLHLQPEKWCEETEAELENIRKMNLITRFNSMIGCRVKFNLLNTKKYTTCVSHNRSRDTTVRFLPWVNLFSPLQTVHKVSGAHRGPYTMGSRGSLPRGYNRQAFKQTTDLNSVLPFTKGVDLSIHSPTACTGTNRPFTLLSIYVQ